jgi:hypothetical protein
MSERRQARLRWARADAAGDDVVRSAIGTIDAFPEDFRITLEATLAQSSYRGATSVEKPAFHGYDFLDAWEGARASLESVPGTVLRSDEAWAWPFLCLRWEIEGKKRRRRRRADARGRVARGVRGVTATGS